MAETGSNSGSPNGASASGQGADASAAGNVQAAGAGAAPSASSDAVADYAIVVQTKQAIQELKKGDIAGGVVSASSAAAGVVTKVVEHKEKIAKVTEKVGEFAKNHESEILKKVAENSGKLSGKLEEIEHSGALGRTNTKLAVAANIVTLAHAAMQGKTSDEQLHNAEVSGGQMVIDATVQKVAGAEGAGFASMADNAFANTVARHDAGVAKDHIQADTKDYKNLRATIEELKTETKKDEHGKEVKDPKTHKPELAYPKLQDLHLDTNKHVDLTNGDNQKIIQKALEDKNKDLSKTTDKNAKVVVSLPVLGGVHVSDKLDSVAGMTEGKWGAAQDSFRDQADVKAHLEAEKQQKAVQVSMAELSHAEDSSKFTRNTGQKTASQEHDDAVVGMRGDGKHEHSGIPVKNMMYTAVPGADGKMADGKFVAADDKNQPLPEAMLKAYKTDPEHNRVYEEVLYKKGPDGKPVLDENKQMVPQEIRRYEIVEKDKQRQGELGMTAAEQRDAFQSTWKAEAIHNKDSLAKDVDKAAAGFSAKDGASVGEGKYVQAYEQYHAQLENMKANAQNLGLNKDEVKQVDAKLKTAEQQYNEKISADFDQKLKAYSSAGDSDKGRGDLVASYTKYHEELEYIKTNAKVLGVSAQEVKKIDALEKNADAQYNKAFDTKVAENKAAEQPKTEGKKLTPMEMALAQAKGAGVSGGATYAVHDAVQPQTAAPHVIASNGPSVGAARGA